MALPAVSEVFKGSIDESLKKLVQPAGIVPATVLVLMNLAVIYPRLLDAGVPAATTFDGLEDPWKAVVISGLVLVLGYVILNLSGSAMRLATGELIADSDIGRSLASREGRRIDREISAAKAKERIRSDQSRFPLPKDAAPTRLGNVFAGSNTSLYKRYGFDMAAMWGHLQTVVAKEDEALGTSLEEAYTGVQVLVNLAVTVLIVGAEAALITLVARDAEIAVLAILSIPVAFGLYRAASAQARSYTDLVEVAVDLYRAKVGEKFGLKATDKPEKDRPAWVSLRSWLLWDRRDEPEADAEATLEVTTTSSENVSIKALPVLMATDHVLDERPGYLAAQWQEDYSFLISPKVPDECCNTETKSSLLLSAGKDWVLDVPPKVEIGGRAYSPAILRGGTSGDSLLVRARLSGVSSTDVIVKYLRRRVELAVEATDEKETSIKLRFEQPPVIGEELRFRLVPEPPIDKTEKSVRVEIRFRASWMAAKEPKLRLGKEQDLKVVLKDGMWVARALLSGEPRLVARAPSGESKPSEPPPSNDRSLTTPGDGPSEGDAPETPQATEPRPPPSADEEGERA